MWSELSWWCKRIKQLYSMSRLKRVYLDIRYKKIKPIICPCRLHLINQIFVLLVPSEKREHTERIIRDIHFQYRLSVDCKYKKCDSWYNRVTWSLEASMRLLTVLRGLGDKSYRSITKMWWKVQEKNSE